MPMTTKKQIKANQGNATRSTGPVTVAGRARSSKNALKHGLTAEEITLGADEANKFAAFRDDIIEAFAPCGALEEHLAEEYAILSWRLRRVPRLEMTEIEHHQESALGVKIVRKPMLELMLEGSGRLLTRYESSLHRMRQRVLYDLERLQARRRGEAVSAPIVMDITHSLRSGPGREVSRAGDNDHSNGGESVPSPMAALPSDS
jgi:hypothetical protein